MTCIVGVEHEGSVYIGGDSAAIDECMGICLCADEKVFITDGGDLAIGYAGSFRIGQLMRYAFVVPDQPSKKDDMAYMVTDFVDAVRAVQRDKGAMTKENELEVHDAELVVGYNGKLYVVDAYYRVGRPVEDYTAVGSGAPVALGALYATRGQDLTPEDRIRLALKASSEYSAGVRPPFHIVRLGAD